MGLFRTGLQIVIFQTLSFDTMKNTSFEIGIGNINISFLAVESPYLSEVLEDTGFFTLFGNVST
jgi:hypothetical protein